MVEDEDIQKMWVGIKEPSHIINKTKKIMWSMVQFKELQMMYICALKEIRTKFEILDTDFNLLYKRNPINSIHTRLKSLESILDKLTRHNYDITLESVIENIHDVAGIRVVCSYIDDIYKIADALIQQDDITLIKRKDYIKNPKPNGYRSLHLIVEVPVFFAEHKKNVKVEVQIRTIAMDFWASLEHQLKYKKEIENQASICNELKECADVISATDEKMLKLRIKIDQAAKEPTEEDILLDKFKKLDMPIG